MRNNSERKPTLQYEDVASSGVSRRQYVSILSALGVGTLAGCLGDDDDDTADDTADDDDGVDDGDDDDGVDDDPGDPVEGGTLEIALTTGASNLDGLTQTAPSDQVITYLNTDFLFRVNQDFEVVGGLVDDVDVEGDGEEWRLHLHEGVTYHDPTDRELIAEDIVWTLDRIVDPDFFTARHEPWILDAEWHAEDDHTFVLEFDPGWLNWDGYMAGWHGFPIYSPDAVDDGMDMQTEPVATGPFEFEEWVTGEHVTLTKFDDYWHDDYPYVDEVVFRPIPDGSTRVTELTQGDIDIVLDPPFDQLDLLEDEGDIVVDRADSFEILDLIINPTEEPDENRGEDFPTTHREIRQAVSEAIDRNEMVEIIYGGNATPSQNYFPEGSPWHIDYNPHAMEADPDAAADLIDEAGFDEPEVTLISASDRPTLRDLGQLAAEHLENAGFAVDLQEYEQTAWSDLLWAGEYDISVEDLFGAPDPIALRGFWAYGPDESSFFNFEYEDSETIYQMWDEEARREPDFETRQEIFADVQRAIVDDPIRCVVCHPDRINAYKDRVHNFSTHPWASNVEAKRAWLDE